jgi:hypothetical protein
MEIFIKSVSIERRSEIAFSLFGDLKVWNSTKVSKCKSYDKRQNNTIHVDIRTN